MPLFFLHNAGQSRTPHKLKPTEYFPVSLSSQQPPLAHVVVFGLPQLRAICQGCMVPPHNWVGSLPEGIWFQTMLAQMNALVDTPSAICSTGNPFSGPLMKCSQHITICSPYKRFHAVGIMRGCYLKMNILQKYHISLHEFA